MNIENPLLDIDEVLLTLSIASQIDENARLCLEALPKLKDCEIHSTVILSKKDTMTLRNLHMNLTCDPKYSARIFKYHNHAYKSVESNFVSHNKI